MVNIAPALKDINTYIYIPVGDMANIFYHGISILYHYTVIIL